MEAAIKTVDGKVVDPIAALMGEGRSREAVAECAKTHGAVIGRLCMAMLGSQAEAEEALQDTLLAAHDALASWRAEGTLRAWLFGIARRVCARRLERHSTRERRLRLVAGGEGEGSGGKDLPDALLDARRQATAVRQALERLSPTEREAVILRYQADLSFKEIAQACGIDEATARKRVSRGLLRLRTLLGEEKP